MRAHTAPRNTLHKAESEAYETEVQLLLKVRGFRVLWESSSSDLEWVSLNKDQETDRPPTWGKHVLVLKFSNLLTSWETVDQKKKPMRPAGLYLSGQEYGRLQYLLTILLSGCGHSFYLSASQGSDSKALTL